MYYQYTLNIKHFIGTVSNGGSEADNVEPIPCIGWPILYGMIYSDVAVTLNVLEGVKMDGGSVTNRDTTPYAVGAGNTVRIEHYLSGSFVTLEVDNSSGGNAAIEMCFQLRGKA